MPVVDLRGDQRDTGFETAEVVGKGPEGVDCSQPAAPVAGRSSALEREAHSVPFDLLVV